MAEISIEIKTKDNRESSIPITDTITRNEVLRLRADEYMDKYNYPINTPKFDQLLAEAELSRDVANTLHLVALRKEKDQLGFTQMGENLRTAIQDMASNMTGQEVLDKTVKKVRSLNEIGDIKPGSTTNLELSEAIVIYRVVTSAAEFGENEEKQDRIDYESGFRMVNESCIPTVEYLKDKKETFVKKVTNK